MRISFGLGDQAACPPCEKTSPLAAAASSAIIATIAGSLTAWVIEELVRKKRK